MLNRTIKEYTKGAVNYAGLLPEFTKPYDGSVPLKVVMQHQYGMPLLVMEGTINTKGEYCYPEDKPLPKLLDIEMSDGACLTVYQYAIVCIKEADGSFIITRMD